MSGENNTITEETRGTDNNSGQGSAGVPVIADGALCICNGASSPKPQSLAVISQQKVLCNGASKLAATTNDNNIVNLNFASCRLKNNGPCTCSIQWQNFYKDINVGGGNILTMSTTGLCSGQQISFKTCGQCEVVRPSRNITISEAEVLSNQNQLINTQDIRTSPVDLPNLPSDSETDILSELNSEILNQIGEQINTELDAIDIRVDPSTSDNKGRVLGIKAETYPLERRGGILLQPVNKLCEFSVNTAGTLSWLVKDENMNTIFSQDGGNKIKVRFPDKKDSNGAYPKYVIEAFGNKTTTKDSTTIGDLESNSDTYFNTLVVQPARNEIILKSNKSECSLNSEIDITLDRLFLGMEADMAVCNFEVRQANIPVAAETAEITETANGAKVLFKKPGDYVVTAESAANKPLKVHPTNNIKVKQLSVTAVSVNGSRGTYSARKGVALSFSVDLSVEGADSSDVKWEVAFNNGSETKNYSTGNEKPGMNIFQKPGTYKVYAFFRGKSENVKVVVEITEPTFEKVIWRDANGNSILKEIGKREKLFANIFLKGAAGIDFKLDLCGNNDKVYRSFPKNSYKILPNNSQYTVLEVEVQLADFYKTDLKALKNGELLFFKIQPVDNKLSIINGTKSKDFGVKYTTKERITSLKFYADKECTQEIITATYNDVIYAKALSRNLTGSKIRLYIFRDKDWAIDKTLFNKDSDVQDDGSVIFDITINKDWKIENDDDFYVVKLTETGSSVGGSTAKLGFDKKSDDKSGVEHSANIRAMLGRIVDEEGKVITRVASTPTNNNEDTKKTDCPRCKDFTEDNFKTLFPDVEKLFGKGTNSLTSTSIKDFAEELKKAFDEFGIDNCNRRIHFLTQISCETGDFLRIDEDLNYSEKGLKNVRSSFWPEENHPKLYESDFKTKFVGKPEALANYVYRERKNDKGTIVGGGGNGDEASGDGYKYRGRGLFQLTFKNNYQFFEDYLVKKDKIAKGTIMNNPDILLSNLNYMVRSAAWFWKYSKGNDGTDRLDISKLADKGDIGKITLWTHGNRSTVPQRAERYSKLMTFYDIGLCNFFMDHLATDYTIDYHIRTNTIDKYIPKGKTENEIFHYRYYYHDESDTEYFLCAVMGYFTQKWLKGTKIAHSGKDWVKQGEVYFQKDGSNQCILVVVPKTLEVSNLFSYHDNTKRACANPDAYAIMLAAIADTRYIDFRFNGFTDSTGRGAPSVSHINGINLDIRYLKKKNPDTQILINTKAGWDMLDLDRHNIFMKKAYDRGFKQYYIMPLKTAFSGHTKSGWDQMCESLATTLDKDTSDVKGKIYLHGSPHEHHVHLQGFTKENITIKEK